MTDGTQANQAGASAEKMVAQMLVTAGYTEVTGRDKTALNKRVRAGGDPIKTLSEYGAKIFVQKLKGYPSCYGVPHSHDFVLYHRSKLPWGVIVEVKWQTVGGSVDEKFPFVVLSFKGMPVGIQTILLIDGGGARADATRWAKGQTRGDFITMTSIGEFTRWLRKHG
jgi:hypothetical protein